MADFSAYQVTGTDNPARQISVDEWNNLLVDLETATNAAGITPQQFGAASGASAAVNGAAFEAAIAYLKSIAVNDDVYYKGSPKLFIPAGEYDLDRTLDITHTLIIEGESSVNGYSTRLNFPVGTSGIRVQAYNTSGGSSAGATHYSGSYTIIRNIGLCGPYPNSADFTGHAEGEYHGIHVRTNVIIEDVFIDGFQGDGVHALTSAGGGGAEEGNSNCSFINRIKVTNVRNGVFLDGADANAWTLIGVVGSYCRQHTVWDASFLGNTHIGHHSANAGLVPGVSPSIVHYSGNRYAVRQGQAAGAATNAPSGTTTDNTWWLYQAAGGAEPTLNIPTWANPTTVREGGSYRSDSPNAYNVFMGCYQEGGEGVAQFVSPTLVMGGSYGGRSPVTTGNYITGSSIVAPNPVTTSFLRVAEPVATTPLLNIHNSIALQASVQARQSYSIGYESGDVTPAVMGAIYAYSSSGVVATAEGSLVFATRSSGGAITDRLVLDTGNLSLRGDADNVIDLGFAARRYKGIFGYTGDFTTQVKVNGVKVLGAQGAALPADATDLATAITLVNAIKARMVAHGLVA